MPRKTSPMQSPPTRSLTEMRLAASSRDDARDRRVLRSTVALAVALHLGLLLAPRPEAAAEPEGTKAPQRLHMMETVRFKPPAPEPEPPPPPKPKARKVPVPDPTPDAPEPIRIPLPEPVELPDVVPTFAPPAPPPEPAPPEGPIYMAAHIEKPVRTHFVEPRYPEIARKVRLQGLVILQSTIDETGHVVEVEVLKGLPMGLTESAVRAVRHWRFEPARLDGRPVAVYFTLTVHFHLD